MINLGSHAPLLDPFVDGDLALPSNTLIERECTSVLANHALQFDESVRCGFSLGISDGGLGYR